MRMHTKRCVYNDHTMGSFHWACGQSEGCEIAQPFVLCPVLLLVGSSALNKKLVTFLE